MKLFSNLLIVAALMFFAACSKENMEIVDVYGNPRVLVGKWKLSETLNDPGDGSGEWKKVPKDSSKLIVFEENGRLSGDAFAGYTTYTVQDSVTLKFTKADGVSYQNYSYKLQAGALSLNPAGPIMCIEACGIRFTKVD